MTTSLRVWSIYHFPDSRKRYFVACTCKLFLATRFVHGCGIDDVKYGRECTNEESRQSSLCIAKIWGYIYSSLPKNRYLLDIFYFTSFEYITHIDRYMCLRRIRFVNKKSAEIIIKNRTLH